MNLNRIKIRGLGATPETNWLDISDGLTHFHLPDQRSCTGFARAIQTINPPYRCQQTAPYADLPDRIIYRDHTRVVKPGKRTVAIGVFNSTPQLVHQLAGCSPLFYETDRIEVGRRLDYTRWMIFVELASSTRWSEISEEIEDLYYSGTTPSDIDNSIGSLIKTLRPTDRIKDPILGELAGWLHGLQNKLPAHQVEHIQELVSMVKRAHHFSAARKIVKLHLPFFFVIDPTGAPIKRVQVNNGSPYDSNLSPIPFLINLAHHRAAQSADPDQPALMVEKINKEFSRFTSGQLLRFEQGTASYTIQATDSRDGKKAGVHPDHPCCPESLADSCYFIIAAATVLTGSPPILIFHQDNPSAQNFSSALTGREISRIAAHCQCLYMSGKSEAWQRESEAPCHHFDDFVIRRDVPLEYDQRGTSR